MSEQSDNMRIWDANCRTTFANVEHVKMRGGFHTADAQQVIKRATEVFGPIGIGWKWSARYELLGDVCYADVTLHYKDDGQWSEPYGPVRAGFELKQGAKLDPDAFKKAATNGISKCLSHLGFCSDVYEGKFDTPGYDPESDPDGPPEPKIDPAHVATITAESLRTGVPLEKIATGYKVASIEDVPASKAAEIIGALKKRGDAA
ncbi:MAG: hypothetical protein AAF532_16445 [Planctomycetota bacterium]